MEEQTISTEGRKERRNAFAALAALALMATGALPAGAQNAARLAETPAGSVLADALREMSSAVAAFVPASALRSDGDLEKVAPAAVVGLLATAHDSVVVMDLTGKQVLDALERSVSFAGKPFPGFLQVSGIQMRYSPTRPSGKRVISVAVGGKPVDPARRYKIAMPRPLADGQAGYFQIWNKDQIAQDTGKSLGDALTLLATRRPAAQGVDGRIATDTGKAPAP